MIKFGVVFVNENLLKQYHEKNWMSFFDYYEHTDPGFMSED
jgi:hypothetical protein